MIHFRQFSLCSVCADTTRTLSIECSRRIQANSHIVGHTVWFDAAKFFLQSAQRIVDRPLKTTIPNFVYLQDWTSNFEIDWRASKRLHFSILFSNLYSRLNRKFRFEHQNSTTSNARSLTESLGILSWGSKLLKLRKQATLWWALIVQIKMRIRIIIKIWICRFAEKSVQMFIWLCSD